MPASHILYPIGLYKNQRGCGWHMVQHEWRWAFIWQLSSFIAYSCTLKKETEGLRPPENLEFEERMSGKWLCSSASQACHALLFWKNHRAFCQDLTQTSCSEVLPRGAMWRHARSSGCNGRAIPQGNQELSEVSVPKWETLPSAVPIVILWIENWKWYASWCHGAKGKNDAILYSVHLSVTKICK